ncbi:hypothetical protein ANN_12167 [Periplaneta americana]|uniref:T-box domain-containing protein n=1 Tax=Periplaneta americana TaxID=6978 RepID=A0ABQ8T725_PERAM|nr:hypothetical protein ANN_12167 [Periplaneta americana]
MAGLCEGGNEPTGSLKAKRLSQAAGRRHRDADLDDEDGGGARAGRRAARGADELETAPASDSESHPAAEDDEEDVEVDVEECSDGEAQLEARVPPLKGASECGSEQGDERDGDSPDPADEKAGAAARVKIRCNCEELLQADCHLETKELWDKFHDLGTEMIITKTGRKKKSFEVHEEVHCVASEGGGIRRADIVALDKTNSKDFILDPTVRFEMSQTQPSEANKEKQQIYEPTIPYFREKYQMEGTWEVLGLMIGARGTIPRSTVNTVKTFGIHDIIPKVITSSNKESVAILKNHLYEIS